MKKCARCNTYFGDGQRDLVCNFHVSPWIDLHTPGKGLARVGVWTCCKEITRDAPGCKAGVHVEDQITAEHLRKFEVFAVKGSSHKEALELLDTEFLQRNLGHTHVHLLNHNHINHNNNNSSNNNKSSGSGFSSSKFNFNSNSNGNGADGASRLRRKKKDDNEEVEGYIRHSVQLTDTLPGIALRYETNVQLIKQINKLFSNTDLYKYKTILVPTPALIPSSSLSPSPSLSLADQVRKVNKLAIEENISKEEAKYYLSDNNWDLDLARSTFSEDMAWAAEEWSRLHGKGKFKEWLGDSDVQTVAVVACGAILVLLLVVL